AATTVKPLRGRSADAKASPVEGDAPRLLLKAQLLWKSPAYLFGRVAILLVLVFITLYPFLRSKPASIKSKSVAVLPFVNMSADKEDEYFSDGLTEELINALTKIEGLRVPARTSAFSFKATQGDIRKIGEQLNVGTVMEGSVRQLGEYDSRTAHLINVADAFV